MPNKIFLTHKKMSVKEEETITVKKEEVSESAEAPATCRFCDNHPCLLVEAEPLLEELVDTYAGSLSNKQLRYKMYTEYTSFVHGHLGKRVRRKVPSCVEKRIRSLAPSKSYTGFKLANDDEE